MGVNALIYAVIVLVVFGLVWWLVEMFVSGYYVFSSGFFSRFILPAHVIDQILAHKFPAATFHAAN